MRQLSTTAAVNAVNANTADGRESRTTGDARQASKVMRTAKQTRG